MRSKSASRVLAALLAPAILPSCGYSPVFPESRPGAYPVVQTMLVQEAFRLEHGSATTIDFQASDRGVLFATVDWTHASNNVVAVLADQGCASVNLALAGNCDQGLTFSEPSTCTAKPRILTASIAAGRPVRLYVANAGASAESGRVEVTLCRDSPGCESGAACGQCELQATVRGSCP